MELRPAGVRLSPTARVTISNLLIVSGMSGSGKSTFLRALAGGKLSEDLKAALPTGAEKWPHTNGSRVRGDVSGKREGDHLRLAGVVLHYDIMRVFETRIERYADDLALAVLAKADAVTVVLITPPADALATQIAGKARAQSWMRRGLKQFEDGVSRLLRPDRASVYDGKDSEARHRRLSELYRQPDFLPRYYAAWREFVERTAGGRLTRPILEIEPRADLGREGFRLVDGPPGRLR